MREQGRTRRKDEIEDIRKNTWGGEVCSGLMSHSVFFLSGSWRVITTFRVKYSGISLFYISPITTDITFMSTMARINECVLKIHHVLLLDT